MLVSREAVNQKSLFIDDNLPGKMDNMTSEATHNIKSLTPAQPHNFKWGQNYVTSFHIICSPAPGLVTAGGAGYQNICGSQPKGNLATNEIIHQALTPIEGLLLFSLQAKPTANLNELQEVLS